MKEDLDVVHILKRLRELQVIVDNSKINENIRYKVDHSYNNVLNLEDHEDQDHQKTRSILISDVDREETPTPKKKYDDMFKYGISPF